MKTWLNIESDYKSLANIFINLLKEIRVSKILANCFILVTVLLAFLQGCLKYPETIHILTRLIWYPGFEVSFILSATFKTFMLIAIFSTTGSFVYKKFCDCMPKSTIVSKVFVLGFVFVFVGKYFLVPTSLTEFIYSTQQRER